MTDSFKIISTHDKSYPSKIEIVYNDEVSSPTTVMNTT
jgi:hypothetical protein